MPKPWGFSIFSVNELLASPRLKPVMERLHPAAVLAIVKGVYEDVTREMVSAASERRVPEIADLTEKILARLLDVEERGNRLVLDARGILFPDAKLEAPLSGPILDEMLWRLDVPHAGGDPPIPNDELVERIWPNIEKTAKLLGSLTGAADLLFFTSREAAEVAVMQTFGGGNRKTLLARRDFYADAGNGSFDDLLQTAGVAPREVGGANRATLNDFLSQMTDEVSLIRFAAPVHTGLTPTLSVEEIATLRSTIEGGRVPIFLSLDFAPLLDLSEFLDTKVPTVGEWLGEGIDLVLVGGGQLIGAPNLGILFGSKPLLDGIRRRKFPELFSPHRTDLSGIFRTTMLSRHRDEALRTIPILQTVSVAVANRRNRAERIAPQIEATGWSESVRVEECRAPLCWGNGSPSLNSSGLAIKPRGKKPAELARRLELAAPGLRATIKGGELLINLATIPPAWDSLIVQIFERL